MLAKSSMSPYAPVRYREHAWWRFAREVAQAGYVVKSGGIASLLPDLIMSSLCQPMAEEAVRQFKNQEDGSSIALNVMAKAMEFRHWIPLAAQYELCGRQIFDLTDELVEMLTETDIGDCTLEGWHAPYDAFFVRFGKQEAMKVAFDDDFEYLDGAFVATTPWGDNPDDPNERRIKIGFTTVHADGSGVDMPGYFLDLNPSEQRMPILKGIEASIERRVAGMGASDTPVTKSLTECRRGLLEDGQSIMKQAVTLLVNALFYMESATNKGQAISVEPGRDTPPEQEVTWANASPEKRNKLRSRLNSDGYALVRFLGKELHAGGRANTGTIVKTHWRRGHWRQQRVGQGRSEIERRWIRPTMVNAEKSHDDLPGRIYAVGTTDGTAKPH